MLRWTYRASVGRRRGAARRRSRRVRQGGWVVFLNLRTNSSVGNKNVRWFRSKSFPQPSNTTAKYPNKRAFLPNLPQHLNANTPDHVTKQKTLPTLFLQ